MALLKSSQLKDLKIRNSSIVWTIDNWQLIFQLFTILEENNLIQKGIWLQEERYGNKSRTINDKNLVTKLFIQETDIGNCLKNLKVLVYYWMTVKNKISKLEKRLKTTKEMLFVILRV